MDELEVMLLKILDGPAAFIVASTKKFCQLRIDARDKTLLNDDLKRIPNCDLDVGFPKIKVNKIK
jgi:hypothetical protein